MNRLWTLLAVAIPIIVACGTSADDAPIVDTIAGVNDTQTRQSGPATSGTAIPTQTESGSDDTAEAARTFAGSAQTQRDTIAVDISLYLIVDDAESSNPDISTHRTVDELREILDGMNEIWSQADIRFEPRFIGLIEVPEATLRRAVRGDLQTFFAESGNSFTVPQLSTINGFYIRNVGGPNGINPFRSRTFFVIDEPSVHDRRVSSHEIGHIFGLHHVPRDRDRLLFSGTNGMRLTEEEATVARYVAQGILDGVR